jgi:hypothetical protein
MLESQKLQQQFEGGGGWITKRIQSVKHQATFYVSI